MCRQPHKSFKSPNFRLFWRSAPDKHHVVLRKSGQGHGKGCWVSGCLGLTDLSMWSPRQQKYTKAWGANLFAVRATSQTLHSIWFTTQCLGKSLGKCKCVSSIMLSYQGRGEFYISAFSWTLSSCYNSIFSYLNKAKMTAHYKFKILVGTSCLVDGFCRVKYAWFSEIFFLLKWFVTWIIILVGSCS